MPYKAETEVLATLVVRTGALRTMEATGASATLRIGPTTRDLTENIPQPSTGLLLLGLVLLLIFGLPLKSKPHG
jgi:hypothetical protein